MDKPLNIAFLWHHHQPFYKVSGPGERPFFKLPWVRLHAVKDYFDMAALLSRFPSVRQSFNFVPSLLVQLQDYVEHDGEDRIMQLSQKRAETLTEDEKIEILDSFFLAHRPTMIDPYPRYLELFRMKERKQAFQIEDWRDLQAWYNLCWIGNEGRRTEPLSGLFHKAHSFSYDDIGLILDAHRQIMAKVVPVYRALLDAGQIELSVTPFYHPIVPLVCNSRVAGPSQRKILNENVAFEAPEDADFHIHSALSYFKQTFGRPAAGMWPSEGSVSEEAARRFAAHGVRWIATDEQILHHSQTDDEGPGHLRPYRTSDGPVIFFRDHEMSDAIGFVYASKTATAAVEDFVRRAESHRTRLLDAELNPEDHCLSVILDGENCWEYYEAQGEIFLQALFTALAASTTLQTVTFSGFLDRAGDRAVGRIKRLHAGSWINHNFDIWFGTHPEKNTAWQYLAYTRDMVAEAAASGAVSPDRLRRAWEAVYIAEGSDWFWWFGEDHQAHNKHLFDELFRFYLRTAYDAAGTAVPSYLRAPIMTRGRSRPVHVKPTSLITPRIDGRSSHFYEWLDAGVYDAEADGDTMHTTEQWIKKIYYGFDETFLYFRVDFFDEQARRFKDDEGLRVRFEFADGRDLYFRGTEPDAAFDQILELRVTWPAQERAKQLSVSVSVWDGERELVRRPAREPLELQMRDAESDKYLWSI